MYRMVNGAQLYQTSVPISSCSSHVAIQLKAEHNIYMAAPSLLHIQQNRYLQEATYFPAVYYLQHKR